jgi:hypothetical protein
VCVLVVASLGGRLRPYAIANRAFERANGGQASDHYADVSLDRRPVSNRQIVPCHVICMGELDKVLQTQHADNGDTRCMLVWSGSSWKRYLQKSTKKHEHDAKFATTAHGEVLERAQRQHYNNQIEKDVEGCRRPSIGIQVYTLAFMLAIPTRPCERNRDTLQRSGQNESDEVHAACYDSSPDGAS